ARRARLAKPARHPDPARRGHRLELPGEDPGHGRPRRVSRHEFPLSGLFRRTPRDGVRASATRLHERRRHAVPTGGHARGRLERRRADPAGMEGVARARLSKLCGRNLGAEGSGRIDDPGRTSLARLRRMILAGDVGGTNARFALFEARGEKFALKAIEVFACRAHASLEAIIRKFLETRPAKIRRACVGVAGPIRDGRVRMTTLPWAVDSRTLGAELGLKRVHLINDLEANARGIAALKPSDFAVLNKGRPDLAANAALISAGTGLGEAGLHRERRGYVPIPSEGGHADFAPRNEIEIELLKYLLKDYGRVSYERVVSGPGLFNIYRFLRDTGRCKEPEELRKAFEGSDAPAVISRFALESRYDICVRALDLFVSLYGAEAGNLALKMLATGGVFIGGGIAPRILPKLKESAFMQAFGDKGRLSPLVREIPVRVILNDRTALLGAALRAMID